MKDNGLLEYYFYHRNPEGFLKIEEASCLNLGQHSLKYADVAHRNPPEYSIRFYIKPCDKVCMDAEVLLSQVYARAGINTAIYTPAVDRNRHTAVLSNNIENSGMFIKPAVVYSNIRHLYPDTKDAAKIPIQYDSNLALRRYIMPTPLRDYIKMTALDVGAENDDRNICNYIFRTNGTFADELWSFDYGRSGYSFSRGFTYSFPTIFEKASFLPKKEVISELKTNPNVQEIFPRTEMAEMLGSAQIANTARDIKDTIGYEVSPKYVDHLERSFDNLAEELIR